MINRTDSERLEVIIEQLGKIIDLLTPKEIEFQVVTATDAPNGFSVDSDGNVEIEKVEVGHQVTPFVDYDFKPLTRKQITEASKGVHSILADNVFDDGENTSYIYKVMKDGKRTRNCTAEYIVVKKKRKVICLLKDIQTGKVVAKGKAKCDPADTFNADVGMAIALYRALKLNVPGDYLNVPNPTEFEVGQIVYWVSSHKFLITKKRKNDYYDFKRLHDGKHCNNHYVGKAEMSEVTIEEDGVEV